MRNDFSGYSVNVGSVCSPGTMNLLFIYLIILLEVLFRVLNTLYKFCVPLKFAKILSFARRNVIPPLA